MLTGIVSVLDHWQTLVAGVLAIFAAGVTVLGLRMQARDDRARKSRASRALLPAALASVNDYAAATIWWLQDARLAAQIIETQADTPKLVRPGALAQPDAATFDILRDCVEHTEAAPARSIANLLSTMQIHRSRLSALNDRLTNPGHYSGARLLLRKEIDRYIADAVCLHATSDRLFSFARMETDGAPQPKRLSRRGLAQIEPFVVRCERSEFGAVNPDAERKAVGNVRLLRSGHI